MNTKDYIKEFEKRVKAVEDPEFMFDIVSSTHAKQIKRVFSVGVRGDGKRIGRYTSKEYKKRRREKGIPSFTVNFRFTNQLQSDFSNSLTKTKTGWMTGVKNKSDESEDKEDKDASNSEKVEYLIKRYGDKSFTLTKDEKKELNNRLRRKLIKALS